MKSWQTITTITSSRDNNYILIRKKLHWPKKIVLIKNSQFYSNVAEILSILPTHGLFIWTKFDYDRTKIVNFLSWIYFWISVIFLNLSLARSKCNLHFEVSWKQGILICHILNSNFSMKLIHVILSKMSLCIAKLNKRDVSKCFL